MSETTATPETNLSTSESTVTSDTGKSTSLPIRKVGFASFAGAVVVLTVGILNDYIPYFEDKPVSANISAAATVIVEFLVAYLVPPGKDETIVEEEGKLKSAAK